MTNRDKLERIFQIVSDLEGNMRDRPEAYNADLAELVTTIKKLILK